MISEKDVEAERFAFDLAAKFGIDLAQQNRKPLIGWGLFMYVIDETLKRGVDAEAIHQYAKLCGEAYRSMEKKHEKQ